MMMKDRMQEMDGQFKGDGMHRLMKKLLLGSFKLLNLVINAMLFGVSWCILEVGYRLTSQSTLLLMFVFLVLLYGVYRIYGALHISMVQPVDIATAQIISLVIAHALGYCIEALMVLRLFLPVSNLVMLILGIVFVIIWSKLAPKVYDGLHGKLRTIMVYENELAKASVNGLYAQPRRFEVIDTLNALDFTQDVAKLYAKIAQADAVFLCGLSSSLRNDLVKYCMENDIRAYVRPKIGDIVLSGAQNLSIFHVPVLLCRRSKPPITYVACKRAMDILICGIALVLTSPIFALVALAIKLYDHGPVFYKQVRLTKDRREFKIIKFRSMRVDAEKDGVARLASENDDRITPVGHFIRACRLDELPQLINIIRGDMSIVGPRPERPEIAAQYEKELPEFALRLQVPAGLTGYAQVYGKYNTDPYCKLQMDLMYISELSLLQDLRLMFQTAMILFMKESTEGVDQGQTTAVKDNVKESA